MVATKRNGNWLVRARRGLWRPSTRYPFAVLVGVGFIAGILLWGGFNWSLDLTNTEEFCISCHEMRTTPYEELKETVHWSNASGVRAICSDCHVPHEWQHKLVRKVQATSDLYHTIMGTVNTPEKYEERRLEMARSVWASMKAADSRECRNCHQIESMDFISQRSVAQRKHERAIEDGDTCIDCHQGIAHELPRGWEEVYDSLP